MGKFMCIAELQFFFRPAGLGFSVSVAFISQLESVWGTIEWHCVMASGQLGGQVGVEQHCLFLWSCNWVPGQWSK